MITLVSYLVLGIASASVQVPTPSPPQETSSPSPLSPAEISEMQARAEAGDAGAQAALGRAYQTGNGVSQNDALAVKWLRKAADQGDAVAENNLGNMYRVGDGVARDKEEAVRWYKKAAKQGNAKAMFNLGAAYYNGDGVTIDDLISYAWFLLAQESGNAAADEALRRAASERKAKPSEAFVKVAQMYEMGDELTKNSVEALKWYRKAGDEGDAQADLSVTKLLLAPERHPAQEEYVEARQRCETAAKSSLSPAAYCMALIYRRGLGVPKDPIESVKWLRRAAELGHHRAALELGEAYWKGDGVKADLVTAYMWVWLAYSSKVPEAEQDEQGLRKEMTPKQTERAKQKAIELWKSHPQSHPFPGLRGRQG